MPDIPKVSAATESLLSVLTEGHFEYALMGGLAVVLRGYNRYTQDVDALVWNLDERLSDLIGLAEQHGLRLATPEQQEKARSARILHLIAADGTAVDIFLGFLPFERETIDRAENVPLREGLAAKVSSPEDLIIMKLIASRGRDKQDVTALLDLYPEVNKDRIRGVVREYAEALDDPSVTRNLEELIK